MKNYTAFLYNFRFDSLIGLLTNVKDEAHITKSSFVLTPPATPNEALNDETAVETAQ